MNTEPSPTAANAGEDNKLTKTISAAQKVAVAALPLTGLTDSSHLFSISLSRLDFKFGKLNILDLYFEFDAAVFIVISLRNP